MGKDLNSITVNGDRGYGGSRELMAKMPRLHWVVTVLVLLGLWQLAALYINSALLLPYPHKAIKALIESVSDPNVLANLLITMRRVITGFSFAVLVAVPLGYAMGYSKAAMRFMDPVVSSLRQIPIMSWVPLTITWFGLGDGPTIFLIAFAGIFPIIINTIAGVQAISKDYYNAARSMGAGPVSIFAHVIFPGSLPDILTGMRIALSSGWMSVICAEFIATTSGFGYLMVSEQAQLATDKIIALMIVAALVGYSLDRILFFLNKAMTSWKHAQ